MAKWSPYAVRPHYSRLTVHLHYVKDTPGHHTCRRHHVSGLWRIFIRAYRCFVVVDTILVHHLPWVPMAVAWSIQSFVYVSVHRAIHPSNHPWWWECHLQNLMLIIAIAFDDYVKLWCVNVGIYCKWYFSIKHAAHRALTRHPLG